MMYIDVPTTRHLNRQIAWFLSHIRQEQAYQRLGMLQNAVEKKQVPKGHQGTMRAINGEIVFRKEWESEIPEGPNGVSSNI